MVKKGGRAKSSRYHLRIGMGQQFKKMKIKEKYKLIGIKCAEGSFVSCYDSVFTFDGITLWDMEPGFRSDDSFFRNNFMEIYSQIYAMQKGWAD